MRIMIPEAIGEHVARSGATLSLRRDAQGWVASWTAPLAGSLGAIDVTDDDPGLALRQLITAAQIPPSLRPTAPTARERIHVMADAAGWTRVDTHAEDESYYSFAGGYTIAVEWGTGDSVDKATLTGPAGLIAAADELDHRAIARRDAVLRWLAELDAYLPSPPAPEPVVPPTTLPVADQIFTIAYAHGWRLHSQHGTTALLARAGVGVAVDWGTVPFARRCAPDGVITDANSAAGDDVRARVLAWLAEPDEPDADQPAAAGGES